MKFKRRILRITAVLILLTFWGMVLFLIRPAVSRSHQNSPKLPDQSLTEVYQYRPDKLASAAIPTPTIPIIPYDVFDDEAFQKLGLSDLKAFDDEAFQKLPLEERLTDLTNVLLGLQMLHDTFAWDTFLALNSVNPPLWTGWKSAYEVFRQNGAKPSDWGSSRTMPDLPSPEYFSCLEKEFGHNTTGPVKWDDKSVRILFTTAQPSTGEQLWDQNGNPVYYEIVINKKEFDDIVENDLFNRNGQIKYREDNIWFDFQSDGGKGPGAIEIKLAWKIIDENKDDPNRFYTTEAIIVNETGCKQATVGLVGMHIVQKTNDTGLKWIWSTFEQVDNVEVKAEYKGVKYGGQPLRPSFYSPDCPESECPVNMPPPPNLAGPNVVTRTQVTRTLASLPLDTTKSINSLKRQSLANQQSVWQFYELIGTEWSERVSIIDAPPLPIPAKLTNTVIETYDQDQSCMSCHFGAKVPNGLTHTIGADFTFLLGKAQWTTNPLFTIDAKTASSIIDEELPDICYMAEKPLPEEGLLRNEFATQADITLSPDAGAIKTDFWWLVTDGENKYVVEAAKVACVESTEDETQSDLYIYKP